MKRKKALSTIVSVLVLVLITIASAGIIFGIVKMFVNKNLSNSKGCIDVMEQIEINSEYTCYNSSEKTITLSISRKNVILDSVIFSIESKEQSENFELTDNEQTIENIFPFGENPGDSVSLPENESGTSYTIIWNIASEDPSSIQIAPVINGKACNAVDKIDIIQNCA